jgi:uncharacterized protein
VKEASYGGFVPAVTYMFASAGWGWHIETAIHVLRSAYLRENVHYTFAGFNFTPTFLDLMLQVGVDRIMFSADYPYGSMAQARAFLDQSPVSVADREKIAHGNAERLFAL